MIARLRRWLPWLAMAVVVIGFFNNVRYVFNKNRSRW